MSTYRYQGKNLEGRIVSGTIEGESIAAVIDTLSSRGILPVDIQEQRESGTKNRLQQWNYQFRLMTTRVPLEKVQHFYFQMATLLLAGVPLISALNKLALTEDNVLLKKVITDIANEVASGNSLSVAFSHYPKIFPELVVPMINIGENTGNLGNVLEYLALFIDKQLTNRRNLRKALSYPVFVLTFAVCAILALCYWVVPKFSGMFLSLGVELPKMTLLLLGFSNFLTKYIVGILGGILGTVLIVKRLLKVHKVRIFKDRLMLKIPVIGTLVTQAAISQFAWTLGLMVKSGVPLLNALENTVGVLSNKYIAQQLLDVRFALERGESFSQNITDRHIFTPIAEQMIEIAEDSQQFDTILTELANIYDRELSYMTSRITFLIEPLLMVVIGLVVLIMVMGIYFPMWDVVKAVQ